MVAEVVRDWQQRRLRDCVRNAQDIAHLALIAQVQRRPGGTKAVRLQGQHQRPSRRED